MVIKLHCPDILDIEAVMKLNPFKPGINLKRDHLLFIVHTIMHQRAINDDQQLLRKGKTKGFVPLHSTILAKKIPNYHDCIEYLIAASVIECDGKFSPGRRSLGYRLTKAYRVSSLKQVEISDFVLCKKIKADNPFKRDMRAVKEYPHLLKWFTTGKLDIDHQSAIDWISNAKNDQIQKINSGAGNMKLKQEKQEAILEISRNYEILVNRIKEKDYYLHVDEIGNRFHTNLTNLTKGLREFISYDGQPMASIDIKNSQPYMSLPLLGKVFWQSRNLKEKPTLKRIYREKYEKGRENKGRNKNTIKSRLSSKSLIQLDSQKQDFIKNVTDGTFYEFLIKSFEKNGVNLGSSPSEKRTKVKKMVLTILFDNENRIYNRALGSTYQLFKTTFPSVAKVFSDVKQDNYKDLAIILQRIESYLLLKKICKRISTERPFLPIFTIHDSIITTIGNETYVQDVMKDELEKAIGKAPQFSIEYWQKNTVYQVAQAA